MADNYTEQAQANLPEGTGNNPQEDYNLNQEIWDRGSGWVTAEIQTGHGGVEGQWYTFDNTGKAIYADASDNDKCRIVFMLTEDTGAGLEGKFLKEGNWKKTGWGLAVNTHYWLDPTTPGAWTTTRPTSGNIIRLGRADQDTETFHIQITSEVELLAVGGGIAHVTVGPDAGDDYPTISQACTGENPGTIIGVKQNALTEVGDITVKEGQSIIAMGGYHNDGTPGPGDDPSVTVLMGDYQLILPNNDYRIEGIVFDFTPVANEVKVDIDGSNGLIRDCTFDFTGGSAHQGIDVDGGVAWTRFVNLDILADGLTLRPFDMLGSGCDVNNVRIQGGNGFSDDIMYLGGENNVVSGLYISAPSSGDPAQRLLKIIGNDCKLVNVNLDMGSSAISGIENAGINNLITNIECINGEGVLGAFLNGHYCVFSHFKIANTATGSGTDGFGIQVTVGKIGINISDGVISNCGTGIQGLGSNNVRVDGVHFQDIGGTWDIDTNLNDNRWVITRCGLDVGVNIEGDDCVIDQNDGSATPLTIGATAARTIIGNNMGISITDSGTFTKYNARVHYAAVDPTVNDDVNDGFRIGDFWINTATPEIFFCSDPSGGAAVWTSMANGGGSVGFWSVATAAEFKTAIDALQASAYVKGVITITANIATTGSHDPTGALNKDVDFICATGSQFTWEHGNGFQITWDEDGHIVRVINVNLQMTGTTGRSFYSNGGPGGEPNTTLEVHFESCTFDTLTRTGGYSFVAQAFPGRCRVFMEKCDWDNTAFGTASAACYLVGFSSNVAHTDLQLVDLHVIASDIDGPLVHRDSNAPSVYVDVKHSRIVDTGVNGIWNNATPPGSPTDPNGKVTVFYDRASVFLKTLVSGSEPVSFALKGGDSSYDLVVPFDYPTVSQAITALAGPGIIGVAEDFTEIADIVPATGQSILGMGGVNDNIEITMGDFQVLLANKDEVHMEGLKFLFTPVTDEFKIDLDASSDDCHFERLIFSFGGVAQHSGIRDYGNRNKWIDIDIVNNTNSREALHVEGDDSLYERFNITGGQSSSDYLVSVAADSLRNTFRGFRIDGLSASSSEVVYVRDLGGTVKWNLFEDWYIDGTNVTARLWRVEGQHDTYRNIVAELATAGLFWVRNDYNRFESIDTDTIYQPFYFESGAEHNSVIGAHLNNSTNRAILNEGDDNIFTNIVTENTSGVYSWDGGGNAKITASQFDVLFDGHSRLEMEGCTVNNMDLDWQCNNSKFTGCHFGGTVAIEDACSLTQWSSCFFNDLDIEGADQAMFSSCYMISLNVGTGATSQHTMFSACRITNAIVTDAEDTIFSGCEISGTLTNSSSAKKTRVIHTPVGTWATDSGQDTVNDPYFPQTVTAGAANAIKGGRQYDNTGAVGGIGFDLPDPASEQVSIGFRARFIVAAAQEIKINCVTAQTIHSNGNSTTTGTGDVKSSTQWSILELEYMGNDDWVAVANIGTWAFT